MGKTPEERMRELDARMAKIELDARLAKVELDARLAKVGRGRHRNPAKLPPYTPPHLPSQEGRLDMEKEKEKKKEKIAVYCGTCKYWVWRVSEYGYCRRNAPNPFILGPSSEQYHRDWAEARLASEKGEGKKATFDWSPPRNWRVLWPETKVSDHCGEWVVSEGELFFPTKK